MTTWFESGQYERYMETLIGAFNPAAVAGVMCRTTLSVGWDGRLFDCDFNQMLDLPLASDCRGTSATSARMTSTAPPPADHDPSALLRLHGGRGRAARGRSPS